MSKQCSVMFFTPTLGRGGAELQLLRLANGFANRGYDVCVTCIRPGGEYERRLARSCRLVHLTSGIRSATLAGIIAKPRMLRLLREHVPDVLVAVLSQTCMLVGDIVGKLPNPPCIVFGVQNNIQAQLDSGSWWLRLWLRNRLSSAYRKASRIVALSHGAATALVKTYPETSNRLRVVYNAGFDDSVLENVRAFRPVLDGRRPVLVACGRLNVQKDYPTLLRALVRLRVTYPSARLWILGDGPERRSLERAVHSMGLTDAVDFLGFQNNPHAYIAQADVFVLSSQWEGFANVLVEALICSVPVVATDCPYGPGEIIEDGVSGILTAVGDDLALAEAMCRVLSDPALAASLRREGQLRAQKFGAEASIDAYDEIVSELANERVST